MTSKVTPTECFVYITLPGQTAPVTAARFELTKDRRDIAIGRLVYGRSYLARADAVPIDPIELRLAGQTYETVGMKGLFGALRDAGPDYWGRRVIERHVGAAQLNEMDYLLHSPDDRAGALGFGLNQQPPAPKRDFNKTLSLARLQKIADAIIDEEDRPDDAEAAQVEELLLVGTSMGGARPKAVVEDTDGLWIAKFNRKDDKWNSARAEHAMLVLARACGVTTAESKVIVVGGRDVLMVKRFDRERAEGGYLRARMLSGLTLLRAEEGHDTRDRWSYVLLVEELRRISANPRADAAELFRRMLELAQEYDCAIRFPFTHAISSELEQTNKQIPALMEEFNPRRPDAFLVDFYAEGATQEKLMQLIDQLAEGTSEIMCHPGYVDDAFVKESVYNKQRERELKILTDPSIKEAIRSNGINLITFAEL